jgi:hypothetical protein
VVTLKSKVAKPASKLMNKARLQISIDDKEDKEDKEDEETNNTEETKTSEEDDLNEREP